MKGTAAQTAAAREGSFKADSPRAGNSGSDPHPGASELCNFSDSVNQSVHGSLVGKIGTVAVLTLRTAVIDGLMRAWPTASALSVSVIIIVNIIIVIRAA